MKQYREELARITAKMYKKQSDDENKSKILYITVTHLVASLHECMIEGLMTFEEAEAAFYGCMSKGILRTVGDNIKKKNK